MTRKFYFRQLLILVLLGVFYSSCNNAGKKQTTEIINVDIAKEKKGIKDHDKKKGIEIIAEYQASLLKPIDALESTYEDGFLMTEHQKAMKNRFNGISLKSANTIKWTERGPANVPGRIRNIVVAPDDVDKWYAGTVGGGLWVTRDAGKSWENLTDYKVPNLSTSTVVVSESNPSTLYVGTGEPFRNLDAIGGIGLLKTIDDGKTWEYLQNTKNFGGIGRMALNPADENNLVVASSNGVFVTTDGGLTWQQTYNGGNVQDLNHDPTNFNTLYGGVNNVGVIKSADGGLTWQLILDRSDYNANHSRFELDVSPASPNTIFISVFTASGAATTAVNTDFYVSRDAGNTFTLLGFEGEAQAGNLITGQGWYDNIITAHPFNDNVFYAGGVVMYRVEIVNTIRNSLNYTFTPIAAGYNEELNDYVHVDQHGLAVINKGTNQDFKLILANDGGIFYTDYLSDPGTTANDWSTSAVGLNCTQFYGADKRNGVDDYMAGAQDNGTWISLTGGNANDQTKYIRIVGGDGFEVLWNYKDTNKFIGGSQYNNFVRYVNGQGFYASHGESGAGTSPFYSKIVNANNNPDVLFSPSISGVWRSTDFAASWNLTAIPSNFSVGASSALDVSVSIADPDIVWAGNAMTESGSYVMHVSKDNGNSYEATTAFSDPRSGRRHNYYISGIETSPNNENSAYVLFSGQGAAKILKTEDLGQTWIDISGFSTGEERGFPDVAIHSLVEMPFNEDMIWVGTDIGVFQTMNGGQNWTLIPGLPAFSVWQMKIVNDQVVMATHGRGVWTAALNELQGYEPPVYFAPPTIVSAFQKSIYSKSGVVTYVQENEDVDVIIVYLNGQEIDRITDKIAQGTEFTYTFNRLKEGQYAIGLQAINSNQEKSIISSNQLDMIKFKEADDEVVIKTFKTSDVYTYGGQFVVNDLNGTVSKPVLNNSEHPYQNASEYSTVLKHPIEVSSESRYFRYEDVAITEFDPIPGQFFDFVAVEASTDLRDWVRLDTYDAERFPEWTDAFNSDPSPQINDELFREQAIDLLNFFKNEETIVVRFRLISDPLFTSFGWAIRSINVGEDDDDDDDDRIAGINHSKIVIYPTMSKGDVQITSERTIKNSTIEVFGLNGVRVFSKKMEVIDSSQQNLSFGNLHRGMYLVKISSNGDTQTQRIIII